MTNWDIFKVNKNFTSRYQAQYPVPYYQQQPQYQPQYQYGVVAEAEPNSYNVDIDENSDIGDGGELMEKRGPIGHFICQ